VAEIGRRREITAAAARKARLSLAMAIIVAAMEMIGDPRSNAVENHPTKKARFRCSKDLMRY